MTQLENSINNLGDMISGGNTPSIDNTSTEKVVDKTVDDIKVESTIKEVYRVKLLVEDVKDMASKALSNSQEANSNYTSCLSLKGDMLNVRNKIIEEIDTASDYVEAVKDVRDNIKNNKSGLKGTIDLYNEKVLTKEKSVNIKFTKLDKKFTSFEIMFYGILLCTIINLGIFVKYGVNTGGNNTKSGYVVEQRLNNLCNSLDIPLNEC